MVLKNVCFVINEYSEDAKKYADDTRTAMISRGIGVLSEDDMNQGMKADLVLAFGGDGTILRAAQYALRDGIAVLGLNFGRLGFLAEKVPEDPVQLLDCLSKGKYRVEERMILKVEREGNESLYAINDTVISRGGYARLISLEISVDGCPAGKMLSDGIVITTPTGSTGYSVSAGGPVVSPDVDCITITPVCAHSLLQRPLVVSGNSEIRVTLGEDPYQTGVLQLDGRNKGILKQNDTVTVRKDPDKIRVIRLEEQNYYTLVRTKLSEWGTN